ncbi:MAG: hypothetical protein J0L92_28215 [Deltaproteobacteria bacterium]|nr:hypothetical protein [Deltaproteobacteria bacterium]
MTHLKSLRSIAFFLALASLVVAPVVSAQDSPDAGVPASEEPTAEETPPEEPTEETLPRDEEVATPAAVTPATSEIDPAAAAVATEAEEGEDAAEAQAEAEGTTPPTGDSETVPTATPATEAASEDEAQAAEAQAAAEPLAWRNSFFSYSVSATFNSLCRDCQLSYNPNVYQFFSFTPRWYVDASTFFFLSLGAFHEFTDADGSAYNHEFQIGDLLIELRRTIAWEGFIFIPAARLTFPTSKLSQAAQRFANAGIGLTVVRPIPEALGMTIAAVFRYQHWFQGSNVSLAQGDCIASRDTEGATRSTPSTATGPESDTSYLCNSVGRNESDRLVAGVSINVTPVEHFTLTLSLFWVWGYTTDLAAANIPTTGGNVILESQGGAWRNFTSYSVSAAYDLTDWLNLSLTVSNSTVLAPVWNDDGSVRSPFNPDTQFSLGLTFTLDGIYNTITAGGEDDGLTPEERQRRRQGLALRGSDEQTATPSGAAPTTPGSSGAAVTF